MRVTERNGGAVISGLGHGVTCEVIRSGERFAVESIITTIGAERQAIRFESPLHIEATCFVTECKALHEAVVTLLQTCYTGSFFSYNVKF